MYNTLRFRASAICTDRGSEGEGHSWSFAPRACVCVCVYVRAAVLQPQPQWAPESEISNMLGTIRTRSVVAVRSSILMVLLQ